MRAREKCSGTIFVDVDIGHRMALLQMLYIMTLTYIFKVTNFWMWVSRYVNGFRKRL